MSDLAGAPVFAVVAGGGTGGHVLPAIAIARALQSAGHAASTIHFLGSRRGMERRLVPEAGFPITLLPGRGVERRLGIRGATAVLGLALATAQAVILLGRLRPRVVVSVGGYASLPGALAALVWRIPLVIQEQNSVPGAANRLVGRFAKASAVSFPGTPLPRPVVTGNPVRPELQGLDRSPAGRAAARRKLGLPAGDMLVAIAGGSLGARRINEATLGLAAAWAERPGVAIRHVVGERDWDECRSRVPPAVPGGLVYQQVRFEDRMDRIYAAADVAVQRAGAGTVFELAAAGVPAILVPLPGAPGDHQTLNARQLADAGAAVVVADAELSAERLAGELDRLLGDPERLVAMARAAASLARPRAAAEVAALVEAHARD